MQPFSLGEVDQCGWIVAPLRSGACSSRCANGYCAQKDIDLALECIACSSLLPTAAVMSEVGLGLGLRLRLDLI